MNINHLKTYNYYMTTITEECDATYMYTGEKVPEGTYCVQIRGVLKNNEKTTILAGAIYYTGHKSDIVYQNFNQYSNIIVITLTEKGPVFTEPNASFFKILNYEISCFPLKKPPDHY